MNTLSTQTLGELLIVGTTLGFMFIGLFLLFFIKRSKVPHQHSAKPRHPVLKRYSVVKNTSSRYLAKPRYPVAKSVPEQVPVVTNMPYMRIPHLLTKTEQKFFHVLQDAIPDGLMICPQVRLANLVQVTGRYKRQYQHFNRIQAKCVDFVLCDKQSTTPLLVIELDDSSHRRQDRQKRDAFVNEILAHVRLPILHVKIQVHYSVEILTRDIRSMLANGQSGPSQSEINHPHISKKKASMPVPIINPPVQDLFQGLQHQVCRQCGHVMRRQGKFCSFCGTSIHSQ